MVSQCISKGGWIQSSKCERLILRWFDHIHEGIELRTSWSTQSVDRFPKTVSPLFPNYWNLSRFRNCNISCLNADLCVFFPILFTAETILVTIEFVKWLIHFLVWNFSVIHLSVATFLSSRYILVAEKKAKLYLKIPLPKTVATEKWISLKILPYVTVFQIIILIF